MVYLKRLLMQVLPGPESIFHRFLLNLYKIVLYILIFSFSLTAQATVFTFDLRTAEAALQLDEMNTGELLVNGLSATFASLPGSGIDSVFNQTSSRFGINSLGTSADSSSLIDSVNGFSEFVAISFSEFVFLDNIVLSAFAPGEQAQVFIEGRSTITLFALETALDLYEFTKYPVNIGEKLILSHGLGNGFSFDSISLATMQVPEPTISLLMLSAMIVVVAGRCKNPE